MPVCNVTVEVKQKEKAQSPAIHSSGRPATHAHCCSMNSTPYQTALMKQTNRNGTTNPLTSQKLLLSIRSTLAGFSTTVKMQKLRNLFKLFKGSQIEVIMLCITQASTGCIHKAYLHNKYIYLMNMEIKT